MIVPPLCGLSWEFLAQLQWHSHQRLGAVVLAGSAGKAMEGTCHLEIKPRPPVVEQQSLELGQPVHPKLLLAYNSAAAHPPIPPYTLHWPIPDLGPVKSVMRDAHRTYRRGNHACPELSGSASITSDPQSELLCCCRDGGVHTAQTSVCVTAGRVGRFTEHASHAGGQPWGWESLWVEAPESWACLAQVRRVPERGAQHIQERKKKKKKTQLLKKRYKGCLCPIRNPWRKRWVDLSDQVVLLVAK